MTKSMSVVLLFVCLLVGLIAEPCTLAAESDDLKPGPVFRSGRPDGRFVGTAGFVHAYLKSHAPKLEFDPEMDAEKVRTWQVSVRQKLREIMRFPEVPTQPQPILLWTKQRDGYQLQKWEAYPEPLSVVPYLVLVPDRATASSPVPAVMCFPGSASSKESMAGELELNGKPCTHRHRVHNQMALWYVKAGMVAVAVDNPGTCETRDPIRPSRNELCLHAIRLGRDYMGITTFQKLCILEWVKRQPYVDPSRIAASGHSLGSEAALLVAVLDPTVAAVVFNECVRDWRARDVALNIHADAVWHYMPGMLEWFDFTDLIASLAPRPFLGTEGCRTRDVDRIRVAWGLLDADANMKIVHFPKYATPDLRPLDDKEVPEGLTDQQWFRYANLDAPMHFFKENVAVPWLSRVFEPREK